MNTPVPDPQRRRCLQALLGATAWIGSTATAWAATRSSKEYLVLCVDRPAARGLAAAWAEAHGAPAPHSLDLSAAASTAWWHALGRRLRGRQVIAVLDDRTALLWDALLSPSALHTDHQVARPATGNARAVPFHVLQQRF
jgi:hypothetical protein